MNKDINDILEKFLEDKYINIDDFINKHPDLFYCQIYYTKYNQSVNGAAAKVIWEYQTFIYNLASYLIYGKKDSRRLTREQKNKLEVAFKVEKGSSNLVTDFINEIQELLKMIPEEQRGMVFIVCFIFFLLYKGYTKYLDNKRETKKDELIDKAFDKISTKDEGLINIIKNSEKSILNTLPDIDETIIYQGNSYTYEDFKKIKNAKYPKVRSEKKLASLEGYFIVTQINIKKHFIYIEDENEEPKKILYNDDLIANIQGFKDKFKKAIDDEGKIFYIRAGYIIQNGHAKDLTLYDIQERK